jgi:hypothetical protein
VFCRKKQPILCNLRQSATLRIDFDQLVVSNGSKVRRAFPCGLLHCGIWVACAAGFRSEMGQRVTLPVASLGPLPLTAGFPVQGRRTRIVIFRPRSAVAVNLPS